MKTAEEWIQEYKATRFSLKRELVFSNGSLIKAIQLDAFKAGAKWAAQQVYGTPERPSYPEDVNYRSGMKWMKEAVEKRILTAVEQLTEIPK